MELFNGENRGRIRSGCESERGEIESEIRLIESLTQNRTIFRHQWDDLRVFSTLVMVPQGLDLKVALVDFHSR
jgi:hypothetical protein